MHRTRSWILVAAGILLVAGLAGAGAALQAQPTAVAVVNMQQVFDSLSEMTQIRADMRNRAEELTRERDERRQQIQQLRQDLDVLAPGSEAYRQKESELREAALDFQVWAEFERQQLELDEALHMESVYRRTVDAISEVASDSGYDIVLYEEGPLEIEGGNRQEIQSQIAIRKVLYASDSVDITDTVIQRMNNQYEAGQ